MEINILWLLLFAPALVFVGIMLGRRSKSANALADQIQSKLDAAREGFDREREEFRQQIRDLQAKAKSRE